MAPSRTHRPELLDWPLIGRDDELVRIGAARADDGVVGVVVGAAAGVGKSRLAREAVAAAEQRGALTFWVQATRSAGAVPLGALAGVLPPDIRADDPLELMRRTAQALDAAAGGRPVVIGVDDAQLLDPVSAALVLHVAVSRSAFVIATIRSGEPCPDAVDALWKDAGAARLHLRLLDEPDTGRLVEAVLAGPVEEAARRWIFERSGGNALYTHELVLGALEDGALDAVDGYWRLTRRPAPSQSLSELVTERLAGLEPAARRALELLALGEPLRLAEMLELAGGDAVDALDRERLVAIETSGAHGEIRLAHPLYGEVVRASMALSRGRAARLELAAVVQARTERSPEDSVRVARWLLDAGEPVPPPLLGEAAGAAILAGDAALGARLAGLAVEAGGGVAAAMLLARAHAVRKHPAEAEVVLAAWEGRIDSQETAIACLLQRTSNLHWGLQRGDEALALLARARDWWPDAEWRARLDPVRLNVVSLVEGFVGTVAVSEEILAEDLEPEVRRGAEVVHVANLFFAGRTREAFALVLRHRPAVPLRDESDELALMLWSVVGIETGQDFAELQRSMSAILVDGVRADDHAAAGIAALTLGGLCLLAGHYRDSGRWLAEAVVQLERRDPFAALGVAYAMQVGVAHHTGHHEAASAALQRLHALQSAREVLDTQLPYFVRAEAWAALSDGNPPGAQRLLLDAAERLDGLPYYAAQLRYEAMRAGARAGGLVAALASLRERCDARLVTAYADHVAARGDGDGHALMRVVEELEAIGATRYACECAAHAAEAFAAAGRPDSVRRATARCRALHPADQGGTPPEIRGVDRAGVNLTDREAQLVELAARGLSNTEIAERLVLSVRTVESHLYRAMQKLGVSDRRDL